MNKNAAFFYICGVVSGGCIGAAAAIMLLKKKYSDLANEEIESVREMYKAKLEKKEEQEKSDSEETEPEFSEKEGTENDDILKDSGYTFYSNKPTADSIPNKVGTDKPYVISPEEFAEDDEYDKISLLFYADQILADDDNNIVENVNNIVGFESLNHFGEYEDDAVYVRNDRFKCDYEILKDLRNYSDVIKARS